MPRVGGVSSRSVPRWNQVVTHRIATTVDEVVVAVTYGDGVGNLTDFRTRLKALPGGGVTRTKAD